MKSEVKALISVGETPTTPASNGFADAAERALWVGVLVYVFAYVVLFAVGFRFLIYKTAIMPIFVIYGALLRDRKVFLADWLPFRAGPSTPFCTNSLRSMPATATTPRWKTGTRRRRHGPTGSFRSWSTRRARPRSPPGSGPREQQETVQAAMGAGRWARICR